MSEENTVVTATRKIVKKLTVKTCNAKPDIEKLVEWKKGHGTDTLWLLGIVGIASDFIPGHNAETGTSFVKLYGQFKATNLDTGEVFVSGAAILPGAASDLIYGALKGRTGDNPGSIEFAFRIGVHWDETAAVKYVYDVEQAYQPAAADPLAALEDKLRDAEPATNVQRITDATKATGTKGKK